MDADACPVKAEIYRIARRYALGVTLVAAAWMRIPDQPGLALEVVPQGFDAADDWIAARAARGDIVITADIPLAARCVARGATVIGFDGRPFTASNVGDALATRNLLSQMRGAGMETAGPAAFESRDRARFMQALDRAIHALRRGSGAGAAGDEGA